MIAASLRSLAKERRGLVCGLILVTVWAMFGQVHAAKKRRVG